MLAMMRRVLLLPPPRRSFSTVASAKLRYLIRPGGEIQLATPNAYTSKTHRTTNMPFLNRWRRGGPQNQPQAQQYQSQQQQRQGGQQSGSGAQRANHQSNRDGTSRPSSGVWSQDRRSGGSGPGSAAHSPRVGPSPSGHTGPASPPIPPNNAVSPIVPEEKHVPANGYNADEVSEYFKKRMQSLRTFRRSKLVTSAEYQVAVTSAGGGKDLLYKPAQGEGKAAWGTNRKLRVSDEPRDPLLTTITATNMATGRNFFFELTKQIRALEEAQKK